MAPCQETSRGSPQLMETITMQRQCDLIRSRSHVGTYEATPRTTTGRRNGCGKPAISWTFAMPTAEKRKKPFGQFRKKENRIDSTLSCSRRNRLPSGPSHGEGQGA